MLILLLGWVLYTEICIRLSAGFCRPHYDTRTSNGASLLLHTLHSCNYKPLLPLPIHIYILLSSFLHSDLALYEYYPIFLNSAALVQFSILLQATSTLTVLSFHVPTSNHANALLTRPVLLVLTQSAQLSYHNNIQVQWCDDTGYHQT
jgi:hypothetical protein